MASRENARKFHFLREIASGGFGSVYLAKVMHSDGFSRLVAIKLLHRRWSENKEIAQRMRDEARLLGWLRHRNIVDVIDLTSIDGRAAVIMEYLEAVDVKTVVQSLADRGERMPTYAALEVVAFVASALDAAYNRPPYEGEKPLRVIHRDIKPSNIMVDESGTVKVLDFGVARGEFENRESHTQELQFGSVEYMPPERLFFEPETDRADIYSLGASLFEMLTGERLGKAKGRGEKHAAFLEDRLSFLAASCPLPNPEGGSLAKLVRDMCAYNADSRPKAEELVVRARQLARQMPGPALSEWAETVVKPLVAQARREPREPNPITDSVLSEDSTIFGAVEAEAAILAAKEEAAKEAEVLPPADPSAVGDVPREDARWEMLRKAALAEMEKLPDAPPAAMDDDYGDEPTRIGQALPPGALGDSRPFGRSSQGLAAPPTPPTPAPPTPAPPTPAPPTPAPPTPAPPTPAPPTPAPPTPAPPTPAPPTPAPPAPLPKPAPPAPPPAPPPVAAAGKSPAGTRPGRDTWPPADVSAPLPRVATPPSGAPPAGSPVAAAQPAPFISPPPARAPTPSVVSTPMPRALAGVSDGSPAPRPVVPPSAPMPAALLDPPSAEELRPPPPAPPAPAVVPPAVVPPSEPVAAVAPPPMPAPVNAPALGPAPTMIPSVDVDGPRLTANMTMVPMDDMGDAPTTAVKPEPRAEARPQRLPRTEGPVRAAAPVSSDAFEEPKASGGSGLLIFGAVVALGVLAGLVLGGGFVAWRYYQAQQVAVVAPVAVSAAASGGAAPTPAAPAAPAAVAGPNDVVFTSAAADGARLSVACGSATASGTGDVVVPGPVSGSCAVTLVKKDRSRLRADVGSVAAGKYTCFAGDAKSCTK